jgi:choline transport protein
MSTTMEMDSIKHSSSVQTASSFEHQIEDVDDAATVKATKGGTRDDGHDMRRMGKAQELRVGRHGQYTAEHHAN